MNRVFLALYLIAFLATGYRQVTWDPPPEDDTVVESVVPANDPVIQRMDDLDSRLQRLEPPPFKSTSPMSQLGTDMVDAAKMSVNLAIGLVGIMALFLGLVKVAEDGGLMTVLAKLIRPLTVRLFPEIPADHPAMGAIILNLSANAMGLANAATPFGIRAMQQLDSLNKHKGTATNSMVLFLAINTSNVSLLPTGVIGIRAALGSSSPAAIIPTTLVATLFSTTVGILAAKLYQRFAKTAESVTPADEVVDLDALATQGAEAQAAQDDDPVDTSEAYPAWVSVLVVLTLLIWLPLTVVYGKQISPWMLPGIAAGLLFYGWVKGVRVYESFVTGAKDGWNVAVMIIPYLVGILVGVGMFRSSGALDAIIFVLDPFTSALGLPAEALPMALLRPLSGSGALGIMTGIMSDPEVGPDSYTGYLVSTMMGSTETTFYVLAVYFGAVGIKRIRHAMAAALTADVAGVVGAVGATTMYFWFNPI